MSKPPPENPQAAAIALNFMAYLAADETRLERFCALSGMGANDLRDGLQDPAFHGFLLDYALQDESLLLAFAADHGLKPESIMAIRRHLPGYSE